MDARRARDRALVTALIVACALGASPRAAAQLNFALGVGPSAVVESGPALTLEESIGYRMASLALGGEHDVHLVGGAMLSQTLGETSIYGFAGRGAADFELLDRDSFALLLTPLVSIGFSILDPGPAQRDDTNMAFLFEAAAQLEVLVADRRFGMWVRPLGFDIHARDVTFVTYEFLAGVDLRV